MGQPSGEVVLVTRLLVGSWAGNLRSIGQRRRDCLRRKSFNLHCRPVEKQLRRSQVMAFFERLPPCLVGMEACATAHHWARERYRRSQRRWRCMYSPTISRACEHRGR